MRVWVGVVLQTLALRLCGVALRVGCLEVLKCVRNSGVSAILCKRLAGEVAIGYRSKRFCF